MEHLYLEYSRLEGGNITCPVLTNIVAFTLHYCKTSRFKVFLVKKEGGSWNNSLPKEALAGLVVEYTDLRTLPAAVADCTLPAAYTPGNCLVRMGLGGILRHIIKTVHMHEDHHSSLIDILGHKSVCLQGCAETSVWTKFCEVELPMAIEDTENHPQRIDTSTVHIPKALVKLENHFHQPPIISNVMKRKRDIIKKKNAECKTSKFNKDSENATPDILATGGSTDNEKTTRWQVHALALQIDKMEELQHRYAEGTDMTLTDCVILPCISYIFDRWQTLGVLRGVCSHLPLLCEWYHRMWNNPEIFRAGGATCLPNITLPPPDITHSCNIELPKSDEKLINIRDPSKKKFKSQPKAVEAVFSKLKTEINMEEKTHVYEGVLDWHSMPAALHPSEGDLPEKRVKRKCEQLENLVMAVKQVAKVGHKIVDFCSGGGHVGLLLAYLLPQCQVVLVENKEESIQRAKNRVDRLNLTNITLYKCNMDYFAGKFDVGVCLHACGVATDLVLQTCLDNHASFVICPCCYGGIQNTHTMNYPRSQKFKNIGITYQDYLVLGHAADQTSANSTLAKQGKNCMLLIDTDRATVAQEHGYEVKLSTLNPSSCSPKNDLLIGVKL